MNMDSLELHNISTNIHLDLDPSLLNNRPESVPSSVYVTIKYNLPQMSVRTK